MKKENQYETLKERQQKEFNEFPMAFAFSNEQLKDGLKKLGLKENESDKVTSIGYGGFIRTVDVKAFVDMGKRHEDELKDAIKQDLTGEGFIKDMFTSELANHEYGYTYELDDTLETVGLTIDDINENENIKNGLALALKPYCKEEKVKLEEEEL